MYEVWLSRLDADIYSTESNLQSNNINGLALRLKAQPVWYPKFSTGVDGQQQHLHYDIRLDSPSHSYIAAAPCTYYEPQKFMDRKATYPRFQS